MKVAVLGESEADEAAVRILVDGLLGERTEPPEVPPTLSHGWNAVRKVIPGLMKHLHYQTDAEALVVVLDSDLSPVHQKSHEQPGAVEPKCRLCQIRAIVAKVQRELRPRDAYGPIRTAVGLAVPQIEAWYLLGLDSHVGEASWISGLKSGKLPYARENLKQKVYGTNRPSLQTAKRRAVQEAERLVREQRLHRLEEFFPNGFGAFASDVRNW